MHVDKIQKIFDLLQLGTEQERQCMLNQGNLENYNDKNEQNIEILFSHNTNVVYQETSEEGD